MKSWKEPKNKEEFIDLLKQLGVKNPESWENREFDENTVSLFFFLWSLWFGVPNPNEAEKFLSTHIGYYRRAEKIHGSRKQYEPDSIAILEKWLEQGLNPKDICTVIRDAEIDATYRVLGAIEHTQDYLIDRELHYGLYQIELDDDCCPYVQEGKMPIEDEATTWLISAMPKEHPPFPQWC